MKSCVTVTIPSGSLRLEGILFGEKGEDRKPAAVVCHPHPEFGGSMDNNVVYGVRDALLPAGFMVLTFNFRGVGRSEGRYDHMKGEADDVRAGLEYLRTLPDVDQDKIFLVGYSFGGLMALYACAGEPRPRAVAVISPMPPGISFARDARLKPFFETNIPLLVVAGTRDMFCPGMLVKGLVEAAGRRATLVSVNGADHFYAGHEDEAGGAVAEFFGRL